MAGISTLDAIRSYAGLLVNALEEKAFEQLAATNPGIDAALVREAETQLEALRQAGVDYRSSYEIEPALGAAHLRVQSNCAEEVANLPDRG